MTSVITPGIYHERQKRQLCLLHALNNLFQREEFRQAELDDICENLDDRRWFNPHRSWIGLGNYDANILDAALQLKELSVVWFDNRLSVTQINDDMILGYIFNIPSDSYIPFFKGRHWFTVLKIGKTYYNLDSKLPGPIKIESILDFAHQLLSQGNQLLLVTKPEYQSLCVNKSSKE
ncbi:josephin domain-containing protein [Ditylenchus destructor]|nr:josephin domain-containing protein [Ditylenchus destructor]